MTILTAVRSRDIARGAIILTFFGAWWCIEALSYWRERPVWAIPAASVAAMALLALCVMRLMASKTIFPLDTSATAAKRKRVGILFGIIFGIECGLIALCSILLVHRSLGAWIPIIIAVIVGVHFFPLARIFRVPLYYWTGVFSVLGVLGCLLVRDMATRQLCTGLMMAAVLWLTAALLLLRTRSEQPTHV